MSTFVLIHGAAHGGWCWYKVVPLLEKHGHTVLAPDLPGHGKDKTPVADVTLQLYVDSVCKLLDAQREPVILVGHSMGGGIITQVAEERPERIKWLVYLAAALPRNGQSMFERVSARHGVGLVGQFCGRPGSDLRHVSRGGAEGGVL